MAKAKTETADLDKRLAEWEEKLNGREKDLYDWSNELKQRAEDLDKREAELTDRAKNLDQRESEVEKRWADLGKLEQRLIENQSSLADGDETGLPIDPELIGEACEAFGIHPSHVLSSGIDDSGAVVIITHGGKKVRWYEGQEVAPLSEIEITGINPAAKRKKPIAGRARD